MIHSHLGLSRLKTSGLMKMGNYTIDLVVCGLKQAWRPVLHSGICWFLRRSVSGKGKGKSKAVPLQAWSGPEGSRKLRFPDYMTTTQDGGRVVSLTHRPPLPPGNTPDTHFCYRLSRPQGHSAIGRIMSMKNSNDTSWDRTSNLPICSAVNGIITPFSCVWTFRQQV